MRHLPHRDLVQHAVEHRTEDLRPVIGAATVLYEWLELLDTTPEHAGHLGEDHRFEEASHA